MGFPFLTIFMIFIIWLAIRYRRLDALQKQKQDDFWEKEMIANSTPAKDINNLSYITIPMDKFPLNFSSEEKVINIEKELAELSTHRLLNLTGKTNTELKTTYGVPNFETMCKIGEDFDRLTVLLNSYAKEIIAGDQYEKALPVLEFAVGIKTDIAESYRLLGKCYKEIGNDKKLDLLINQVEESELINKTSVLSQLQGS